MDKGNLPDCWVVATILAWEDEECPPYSFQSCMNWSHCYGEKLNIGTKEGDSSTTDKVSEVKATTWYVEPELCLKWVDLYPRGYPCNL